MAQRQQRGWLKKKSRIPGETWVLHFRTTRKSDGRRVENKISIGLVRDLPDKRTAWAEVERLHLPINPVDSRRGVTFAELVLHYAEHELVERTESIHPKAQTTIKGYDRVLRNRLLHQGHGKEAETRMRRQRYAQQREADRQAVAAYLKARDAALPWSVRAVGAVLDFVLRRPRS